MTKDEPVPVTDRAIEETVEMCREMASWSSELEDSYINICFSILAMPLEMDSTECGKIHRGRAYPRYVETGTLVSGQC